MPDYFYDMDLVVDPLNPSNVVAKGQVAIYDPADTAGTTLLALKDPSGLPLPNPLTSNANGFLPPRIASVPQTLWKSGGFEGYFNSFKGLRDEAVSAVAAAQGAADAATTAVAEVVTTAAVDGAGALVLTKANGSTVNAGNVKGPQGAQGPAGLNGSNVLPTAEAIAQAVTTDGPAKTALSATIGTAAQPRAFSADAHSYDTPEWATTALDVCAVGAGPSGTYLAQGVNLRRVRPDGVFHNVGVPTGVTGAPKFVYEWNGSIYAAFVASADSLWKVWKAPAPSLSTDLGVTWTGPVLTTSTGANLSGPMFGSTSTALMVAEQGVPTVGGVTEAHIFRTTDGTNWTAALTVTTPMKHFHAVAGDPFNNGTVYATGGDNQNNCMWKSTNHGATWAPIAIDKAWQAVQISFDANWIYLAPDAVSLAALYVMDRATNEIRVGAVGSPRSLRVARPGNYVAMANTTAASTNLYLANAGENQRDVFRPADVGARIYGAGIPDGVTIAARTSGRTITLSAAATVTAANVDLYIERNEVPLAIAFLGVVDPATGIYYGVTNNETQAAGMPYLRPVLFCVPYVGGPTVPLADLWPVIGPSLFIANGYVWYGPHKRKLIGAP